MYSVDTEGNVYSYYSGKEKILSAAVNPGGYYIVVLYKNKIPKTKSVHRLVAKAFINNHNNRECVNHIDENKLNNNVDNLEWCTNQYNIEYSKALYYVFIKDGITIEIFNLCKFCKENNLSQGNMRLAFLNKRKYHKGYYSRKGYLRRKEYKFIKNGSVINISEGKLEGFCRKHKLNCSNMCQVYLGNRKQHKGYFNIDKGVICG